MYRIRFHGRGGQGMKTASRILGTAFFLQGYEVQDAPRYGAERRGAPVFAYVRASKHRINERGIIRTPDLVVVADDSLFAVCPEILTAGMTEHTMVLVNSSHTGESLQAVVPSGKIITIPRKETGHAETPGILCAASSARLAGVISRKNLKTAILGELASLDPGSIDDNLKTGLDVFDRMNGYAAVIRESLDVSNEPFRSAGWIDLPLHDSARSVPAIHKGRTGALNRTGSWRTCRPSIKEDMCSRCMLCALYCPDSVISAGTAGLPVIDYGHCKGCMICKSICPGHAIEKIPEHKTS
ncbi:MAG TPA: 2-oxoacid:acceptor oxidoreductase family protein [Spirochaetota bacterium]|nr:2-oxoacid:acceptor oxidoreductase family protein [Spirochaetota bacterium]